MLVEHLIGMTDTAFLGRVSEVALGASALGSVYFLAFFVIGTGFSFGAQILIARRNGEKNFSKIGQICYASGFFLIIMSLLLIGVILVFSDDLMPLMIKSQDVCKATVDYVNYRAFGLLFVFISSLFRAFYVGIARTKILSYTSIVMLGSNVILNYSLIFGKFGMPQMGISGAALASAIAEAIAMIFVIIFSLKTVDLKKYGFYAWRACFKLGILKKVLTVSLWMMLQPFLSIAVWFFFFIAIERLGERPLAIINLAHKKKDLLFTNPSLISLHSAPDQPSDSMGEMFSLFPLSEEKSNRQCCV
jgi:putative MATE family efflux protein